MTLPDENMTTIINNSNIVDLVNSHQHMFNKIKFVVLN